MTGESHGDERTGCSRNEAGESFERHAKRGHAVDSLKDVPSLNARKRSWAFGDDALYDYAAVPHLAENNADAAHNGHGAGGGCKHGVLVLRHIVCIAGGAVVDVGQWCAWQCGGGLRNDGAGVVLNTVPHAAELVSELRGGHQMS